MTTFETPPTPEQPAWGPLRAGEILPRTFALYREQFATFFGIALIGGTVMMLLQLPVQLLPFFTHTARANPAHPFAALTLMLPLLVLVSLAGMYISCLVYGAMFTVTDARRQGTLLTVGQAVEYTAPRSLRLFGAYVLAMLRILGWGLLFGLAVIIVCVLVGVGANFSGLKITNFSALSAGLVGAGILALIVAFLLAFVAYCFFCLWVYGRYILFIPIVLAEHVTANASLNRSVEMSRGNKSRIYTVMLAGIAAIVLALIASCPFIFYSAHLQRHGSAGSPVIVIAQMVLITIFQIALTHPILGIGVSLCYFDLKARERAAFMPVSE